MMVKMRLQHIAALLLLWGGVQLALAKVVFEDMTEAQEAQEAQDKENASSGKTPDYFDPATKLLMFIQQNDGLVSQRQPLQIRCCCAQRRCGPHQPQQGTCI